MALKPKLDSDTLVIADHNKALAMGGSSAGNTPALTTKPKTCCWNARSSARCPLPAARAVMACTPMPLTAMSAASIPALQYKALERATRLLIDLCGGEAGPVIDVTSKENLPTRATITLRRSKLDRLIGHHIDDAQVTDILQRLGCEVTVGEGEWQAVAPSWRFDMEIEEDLVEEVARVYGYNNIPDEPVQAGLIMGTHREADLSLKRVKTLLNDKGYQEVITYSFVDPKVQQLIHAGEEALILPSPISSEMSAMRLSLWTGPAGHRGLQPEPSAEPGAHL
ncbi:phenylalanyl-tRNA synthetase subunit beta [Klebsiella pneumoniae]|uniref:Phenylalanine--tRNA ligase beta subunit n=1 Tax=Klebsiella pneumoniae TaxID=573 RepID=A0A378H3F9_KLEPN|nr:phenylalanyl-tRNA synthetase subunit beta [Klebsiella pneumoniae]